LVAVGLGVLIAAAAWWWQGAPCRRLLWLGLGCILASYLLVYSARAEWLYEQMVPWTRYHLLPHLGLVLFLSGGLPRWQERFRFQPSGRLSHRQMIVVAVLAGVLWVCQMPRAVLMNLHIRGQPVEDQQAVLEYLEAMDARCRHYHIDAETAQKALKLRPDFPAMLAVAPDAGLPAGVPWAALVLTSADKPPCWLEIPGCQERENGWDFLRGSNNPRSDLTVEEARLLLAP
jgi:hypothetical protein